MANHYYYYDNTPVDSGKAVVGGIIFFIFMAVNGFVQANFGSWGNFIMITIWTIIIMAVFGVICHFCTKWYRKAQKKYEVEQATKLDKAQPTKEESEWCEEDDGEMDP